MNNINLCDVKYDDLDFFCFDYCGLAKILDIYDGDTCTLVFPYLGKLCKYRARLARIDCSELIKGEISGINARNYFLKLVLNRELESVEIDKLSHKNCRDYIKGLLSENKRLNMIKIYGFDKYGRLLVDIHIDDSQSSTLINNILVDQGWAWGTTLSPKTPSR